MIYGNKTPFQYTARNRSTITTATFYKPKSGTTKARTTFAPIQIITDNIDSPTANRFSVLRYIDLALLNSQTISLIVTKWDTLSPLSIFCAINNIDIARAKRQIAFANIHKIEGPMFYFKLKAAKKKVRTIKINTSNTQTLWAKLPISNKTRM